MKKIRIGDKVYMKDDVSHDIYTVTGIRPAVYVDNNGKEVQYNLLDVSPDNHELASGFTEDYNVELVTQKTEKKKSIKENNVLEYLERLSKDDLLIIIKYGLRLSDAPSDVTAEDIFNLIGCKFIELK